MKRFTAKQLEDRATIMSNWAKGNGDFVSANSPAPDSSLYFIVELTFNRGRIVRYPQGETDFYDHYF